ncbi:MFS transporter [Streptomyces harbinensis]|uniref:CynX/NimT family MFS transporter n=1 Tax=Streptomyces harbinensis TaxID=1176198 RepID=UPI0033917E07
MSQARPGIPLIDAGNDLPAPLPPAVAPTRAPLPHRRLVLLGIVLAALNMRVAVAGVSPLLTDIGDHFGLSATVGGLITTVPLVFMGLGSLVAPGLAARRGTETVLFGALVLLCGGIAVRVAPPVIALFAGGVLVGTAIALLNVLMPGLIKRDFPDRAAPMTALYSTTMILGATVSSATAVPLERALGGWQGPFVSWSLLAAVSALLWLPQVVLARRGAAPAVPGPRPVPQRGPRLTSLPLAWQITLFMGGQSLVAYVVISWLPTILTDQGMDKGEAGLVFAFSTLVQMAGSLLVPVLAGRMRSQRALGVVTAGLMAAGAAGLLIDPVGGAWLWAVLLGVGQGGTLGLALTLMVLRTRTAHTAARLSGMAQTWGYLLAALGPFTLGALRQATGGWTVPVAALLAVCCGLMLLALGAGRDRKI